jgi:hypothetical protein
MVYTLHANAELVAIAYLGQLPELAPSRVASTLPTDVSTWQADGFVQVQTIGGDTNHDFAFEHPVVQVDVWAAPTHSQRPPWGKAHDLAQVLRAGVLGLAGTHVALTLPPAGFPAAVVHAAYFLMPFRRVPGDPANYARYTADLQLHWTEEPA